MKKFKGAVSKKLLAIVGAVAIVGSGLAFSQKGFFFGLNDKSKVMNAIVGIADEYTNTLDDFTPEIGLKELQENFEKNMKSSVELNLNTQALKPLGIETAELRIGNKADIKSKQAMFNIDMKAGKVLDANINIINNGNEYFLFVPTIHQKAFKVNGLTLGEDLNNSIFKDFSPESAEQIEKLKDLKLDPYSVALTDEAIKKEYLNFVKNELSDFVKNLNVEKVETSEKVTAKMAELNIENNNTQQYDVKIKSEYLKPLLLKSIEYSFDRQLKVLKSEYIEQEYAKSLENTKQDIQEKEWPEEIVLNVVLKNDKAFAINYKGEDNKSLELYLLGEKNTTDKIFINAIDTEEHIITSELKKSDDKNELEIKIDKNMNILSSYVPSTMSSITNINSDGEEVLSIVGKYENVKKGSAFDFIMDKLQIKDGNNTLYFAGSLKYDLSDILFETPQESIEILKVSKEEFESISQEVISNIEKNYSAIGYFIMGGMHLLS